MAKAIGFDLGTTNSVACYYDGTTARVLLNASNEELTPSVVGIQQFEGEEAEFLIGRPALSQARLSPEDTIFSIKRLIGRTYQHEDVQRWKTKVAYHITESKEPVAGLATVVMGGKDYLPQEVSAMILKEIKRYSELVLGEPVTHAIITVPAYFGEPERAATREAGKLAGLVVKTLLPEPTAAAIAFGAQAKTDQGTFVLVFDLGGGTFDISIISIVGKDFNVMDISGDHFLGGDDFDMEIVNLIVRDVIQKHGVDLSTDRRFLIVAIDQAEAAKKALSVSESVVIVIPEAARNQGKVINVRMKLTRAEFNRAIQPYVEKCTNLVKAALASQSLTADLINDVLLVGGSTAVPQVYEAIEDLFGRNKVRRDVNPMHCVAIGAGILAHRMKGVECPNCKRVCDEAESACPTCSASLAVARAVTEGMSVTEITANPFGIQVVSGSDAHAFRVLVEKGTPLPMTDARRATFFTAEEGQTSIKAPVYEGLGSNVLQNQKIGDIEFILPTGLPKNHPVHVQLRLDRQSIVTVIIEVDGSPLRHEQVLKRGMVDEPEPAKEESVIDDEDDGITEDEKKLAILENFVSRAESFVSEYEDILSEYQRRRVADAMAKGKEILDRDKAEEAMGAIMSLDRLMLRCGSASLIEQARIVANSADQSTSEQLLKTADALREAARRRDAALEAKLSGPLTALIRQVHQQQNVEQIGTSLTFGGLLRDQKASGGR